MLVRVKPARPHQEVCCCRAGAQRCHPRAPFHPSLAKTLLRHRRHSAMNRAQSYGLDMMQGMDGERYIGIGGTLRF